MSSLLTEPEHTKLQNYSLEEKVDKTHLYAQCGFAAEIPASRQGKDDNN